MNKHTKSFCKDNEIQFAEDLKRLTKNSFLSRPTLPPIQKFILEFGEKIIEILFHYYPIIW